MNVRTLARIALLIALTTLTTMVIKVPIPLPGVHSYVNLGDAVILLSGLIFGPTVGGIAGGLGSSMADILTGYPHWAPWTLVIKGLEGLIAGFFARKYLLGAPLAIIVMITGYLGAGTVIYGFAPALASVPYDILQGIISLIVAFVLFSPLKKYIEK